MKDFFEFTIIIQKANQSGYIGLIEEIPGIVSKGESIDETRKNLYNDLELIIDKKKKLAEKFYGEPVIREKLIYL